MSNVRVSSSSGISMALVNQQLSVGEIWMSCLNFHWQMFGQIDCMGKDGIIIGNIFGANAWRLHHWIIKFEYEFWSNDIYLEGPRRISVTGLGTMWPMWHLRKIISPIAKQRCKKPQNLRFLGLPRWLLDHNPFPINLTTDSLIGYCDRSQPIGCVMSAHWATKLNYHFLRMIGINKCLIMTLRGIPAGVYLFQRFLAKKIINCQQLITS